MQILVIAATTFEIEPFLQQYPQADCLITGVGATVTAYQLTKALYKNKYDLVIQAGIAGSFSNEIILGEVVCVEKDCFADVGVWEKNHLFNIFDLELASPDDFPFQSGWLVNKHSLSFNFEIKKASAITVNLLSDEKNVSEKLFQKYGAALETMEGAAFHYVCLQEKIPFLQLRGISNYVGERDKTKWKLKESINQMNKTLAAIYKATCEI